MPVTTADRPIEAVREEAIDQLVLNYGHGKLSLEAFERRLEEALDSQDQERIAALVADLDLRSDPQYEARKRQHLYAEDLPRELGDSETLFNVFSGSERSGPWSVPGTLRVITVMGGTDIDFTTAEFTTRVVKVKVFCVMGGIDIKVPEGVNVTVKAFCIFGGVGNKARGRHDPTAPTIIIEGLVLFGGTDVKVKLPKRSTKERLLRFADDVKAMFDELGV